MVVHGTGEARRLYWVPCPQCGASNPVNAMSCWCCERGLVPGDALAADAARAAAMPHALPMLRDEAFDHPSDDAPMQVDAPSAGRHSTPAPGFPPPPGQRPLPWRAVAGTVGVAAVGGVLAVLLLRQAPESPGAPAARPDPAARWATLATPPTMAAVAVPAPAPPPRDDTVPAAVDPVPTRAVPQADEGVVVDGPAVAPPRVDPDAPPLPPVKGPCTADVAALGLCTLPAR